MDLKKINDIIGQLADVNEQLISLSDDIWLGINPRDNESVAAGTQFLQDYNLATNQLSQAAATIEQYLFNYFRNDLEKVQSVVEHGNDDTIKNQRMINELDRGKAYTLTDNHNFTFTRPHSFVLEGIAYTNITTWKALYLEVLETLLVTNRTKFLELVNEERFISSRGNPLFTTQPEKLRLPQKLRTGFYAEVNMSANTIKNTILEILDHFDIDQSSLKVYLREDRDKQLS